MKNIITAKGIEKTFYSGKIVTPVLKGIDLEIKEGEFVAIMGRSGAGKSTLMYQLSLLDEPTAGEINVDGTDVIALKNQEKTKFRLDNLGYVFQDYALVPELTAAENVALPLLLREIPQDEALKKASESLPMNRQLI
jgi:putative ABC transport system ATP-binding protein